MALSTDYLYFKDMKSYTLKPGAFQEVRKKASFKGKVVVRVSSTQPITLSMAGPHVEQLEIQGTKEFSFTVDPDTEYFVGLQGKKGFFAKPSAVTFELQMYGSKKAYEALEKVKNLTTMLRDAPDFYELQKDTVKEVLKEVTEVWGHYGDETKNMVKELIAITKKLETK